MKKLIGLMALAVLAAAVAQAGGACCGDKAEAKAEAKAQVTCPIMGGAVNTNIFADVKGCRVYVCCEACKAKVLAEPDQALAKIKENGEMAACAPCDKCGQPMDKCGCKGAHSKDKAACAAKKAEGACGMKAEEPKAEEPKAETPETEAK
jgi:hypothetical protein